MIDAILYLVLTISSTLLIMFGRSRRLKFATVVGVVLPIVYSGLRLNVGTDFQRYVLMYNEITNISFSEYLSSYTVEPTFYLLSVLSKAIFDTPLMVFFVLSLLTAVFFYRGLIKYTKRTSHVLFAWLTYLLIVFPNTMNISRQGVAMSIAFYAFTFIPERKLGKYAAWMSIAVLFHYSTIILLPAYFLNRVVAAKNSDSHNRLRILALVFMLGIVLPGLIILSTSLLPIPEKYVSYIVAGAGANMLFFVIFGLMLLLIGLITLNKGKLDTKVTYVYMYSMIGLSLLFAGFFIGETRRIALYFVPYLGLLIPAVVGMISNRVLKRVAQIAMTLYVFGYFMTFYVLLEYGELYPYQNIFQGAY